MVRHRKTTLSRLGVLCALALVGILAGCAGGEDDRDVIAAASVPKPVDDADDVIVALDGVVHPDLVYLPPVAVDPMRFPRGRVPVSALYDRLPDLGPCDPGLLKAAERQRVLEQVNHVRALHRLPPVRYEPADDASTTAAALIMAANAELTHQPTSDALCWTEAGAEGARTSNLGQHSQSGGYAQHVVPSGIDLWLIDEEVAGLGHRRWLLMPALDTISYGRVIGRPPGRPDVQLFSADAIRVVGPRQDISQLGTAVIAYPFGDYPRHLFPSDKVALSVSILADRGPHGDNGRGVVDFDRAVIRVTGPDGRALPVRDVRQDYEGFGLPNVLYWKLDGVQSGVQYQVEIRDIRVYGVSRVVAYPFRLIATGAPG